MIRARYILLLAIGTVIVTASDVRGQCFSCGGTGGLECLVNQSEFGMKSPCHYWEFCFEGECEWNCAPGGGGTCQIEPEALAMTGQIVEDSPAPELADGYFRIDAEGMVRRRCNDVMIVLLGRELPGFVRANPTRIVL